MEEFTPKERKRINDSQRFNEYRLSKMPEIEFTQTIVRMLDGLEKRIEDTRESLTAEIKE